MVSFVTPSPWTKKKKPRNQVLVDCSIAKNRMFTPVFFYFIFRLINHPGRNAMYAIMFQQNGSKYKIYVPAEHMNEREKRPIYHHVLSVRIILTIDIKCLIFRILFIFFVTMTDRECCLFFFCYLGRQRALSLRISIFIYILYVL